MIENILINNWKMKNENIFILYGFRAFAVEKLPKTIWEKALDNPLLIQLFLKTSGQLELTCKPLLKLNSNE